MDNNLNLQPNNTDILLELKKELSDIKNEIFDIKQDLRYFKASQGHYAQKRDISYLQNELEKVYYKVCDLCSVTKNRLLDVKSQSTMPSVKKEIDTEINKLDHGDQH